MNSKWQPPAQEPGGRHPAMPAVPAELRRYFARHNRRVLSLAGGTLLFVAAAWALAYFAAAWLALLLVTVARGPDATLPSFLPVAFAASAGLLLLWGVLARLDSPDERARDEQSAFQILTDILLAIPRATLTIWGTLSAYQFLNEREMGMAWMLLRLVHREKRLAAHTVVGEIAEAEARWKVITALQLVELLEFHKTPEAAWLAFRNEAARKFVARLVHFRAIPAAPPARDA